ncbi:MAG: type ISP restriction/modification enzyme [Limisphaerales bacterium]
MNPLETYLTELREIHDSGAATKETSGYPALAKLLDTIGHSLKPRVRCIIQLKNSGAGLPDGGLFTPDQLKHHDEQAPLFGLAPARGVLEVKSTSDDLTDIIPSNQIKEYLSLYGQLLLTNYRDFVLLKHAPGTSPWQLESFRLADSEAAFWSAAAHPRKTADILDERFSEYLKRVLLHAAPLNNPRDVAFFLASYARDARARVEHAGDLPALAAVRTALEEALGMKFEAEKGEHFFRSTLVQTLFYGVFSAWVLWHKEKPARTDAFDWKAAAWTLHVPMIKALFEQVATPTKLGPLGLVEVLDWTAAALNRVDRPAFSERFLETHAVQYFYEPFLEAFDPELRKQLGVWYTPPEIVQYQVARVDAVLRTELGIPDGLADPRVFVLDPCCGTATYIVEVLRQIYRFLKDDQGMGALAELYTKKAAQERVFGFEILPAPFVVAHLQIGLLLQSLGLPLDDTKEERVAIYLTNALTGWEPPAEPKQHLLFPEFEEEREAADRVKQQVPILVILGNPPYNGFAGVAVEEERELSNAYRTTIQAPVPQGQGLNDLYVRFFRMAERRIVEKSGQGIVSFISNYSWLDGLSFTGMRERYLEVFDSITVDCLNGDKYKTGKLTPEGKPDPSIFSTEFNREGIQVGTAIATLVCSSRHKKALTRKERTHTPPTPPSASQLFFRHLWGKSKRAELLETLEQPPEKLYQTLTPPLEVGLPFLPAETQSAFFKWPLLPELFPVSFPGVKTSRDEFLVDADRDALTRRTEEYFDPNVSHEEMRRTAPGVMTSTARFKAEFVRDELRQRGFLKKNIVRYCYRPFDMRWLYWEPQTKLLDEKRTEYFLQVFAGNIWLSAGQRNRKEDFYQPQFTTVLADHHIVESNVGMFPLWLKPNPDPSSLFDRDVSDNPKPNLTDAANEYLASLRLANKPEELFYHTLAALHAPLYRTENTGALRQDWPRVPLPESHDALLASTKLGRQVAALLDSETTVPGVTQGKPCPELKHIAELNYSGEADFRVTAGWGHAGKGGVTMPGKGKLLTRAYRPEEQPEPPHLALLGKSTHDIYLNDTAYWRNVPESVWDFTIGGYQVMKKWLSYRDYDLLGRPLTPDEAREVTHMARRLAALILLQPKLDTNYESVKAAGYDWKP